jgi:hypothetical protein
MHYAQTEMTFKDDIYQICKEVASEFEGWNFVAGSFKNKTLKHTDLIVDPGLYFKSGGCDTQPCVAVNNKKAKKICQLVVGWDNWSLLIKYQLESADYRGVNSVMHIYPEKFQAVDMYRKPCAWPTQWIVQAQAKDYLRKVLTDGIGFLHKYFDLSSEEKFLSHLPTSYKWMDGGWPDGSFYDGQDGIMLCVAALVRGDFDFVERYASDDFKTDRPKRELELSKIMAALPNLKRKYTETRSAM